MSADKKSQFKSIALKMLWGGLLLVILGLVYFYCTPRIYRAMAKVKILKSGWNTNDSTQSFGPEMLPAECQIVRSNAMLDQSIKNLGLAEAWNKSTNRNTAITTNEIRDRLKLMLDVHPAPNASMIEIQATGADAADDARIVNELARLYHEFRDQGRQQASHHGMNSLRDKLAVQTQKVQAAENALGELRRQINAERRTNLDVYDPKVQTERLALEDDYVKKKNQFDKLKGMDKEDLKNVLSSMDKGSNTVLAGAVRQYISAKNDLRKAQLQHAADSPELKGATLAAEQLNTRINGLVDSLMSYKEADLAAMKSELDRMASLIDKSKNNAVDLDRFAAQDASFVKAREDVSKAIRDRDVIEAEMLNNGLVTAVVPSFIATEIVELADQPTRPITPDRRIVTFTIISGSGLVALGLLLLLALHTKPRVIAKKAV